MMPRSRDGWWPGSEAVPAQNMGTRQGSCALSGSGAGNDHSDLIALRHVLDDDELARARAACELIQQRGFHRGRDLLALLDTLLEARE
jgi:hypothetical protein